MLRLRELPNHFEGLASGVVFASIAVLAMTMSTEIMAGWVVDSRMIIVGIASAFGGPIAGVTTVFVVSIARILIGGVGIWVCRNSIRRGHWYTFLDVEINLNRSDGSYLTCSYSGDTIEIGGQQCLLSVVSDISKRKKAEMDLELQAVNLNAIFNSVPSILMLVDDSCRG